MPSDSDFTPNKRKKTKKRILVSSSSSSEDDFNISVTQRRVRRSRRRVSSSSEDTDGSSFSMHAHKKQKVLVVSDSDSSSCSDFEMKAVCRRPSKVKPLALLSDSDSSEENINQGVKSEMSSCTSDDEKEKCIICFKTFRGVMAHPSGCRHNFHSECLLTWSQTSNTCPIDRVKYTAVIATKLDGSVISRTEVSSPPPQDHNNDIVPDDPTFCEVCRQHDREHQMLLCDRCEAGYHLDCLDPPLVEVPVGDWYCPNCANGNDVDDFIDHEEINDLLQEGGVIEARLRQRQPPQQRRVGPRTRAAQRVIATIRQMAEETERNQPSSSTSRSTSHRRKKSRHSRSTRYKVELITVEDGSTIEVKVAVNTRSRRKSKKKKSKSSCARGRKHSSKRSSASAGGGIDNQSTINSIIQPLDIFGSRPQLEYFSGCDAEDELDEEGSGGLSVLRAPRIRTGVRGRATAKQVAAQIIRSTPHRPTPRIAVSSAPPDLLSSILDEQTKWHSPNAVIQSNSQGDVTVVLPDKAHIKQAAATGESSTSGGSAGPGAGSASSTAGRSAGQTGGKSGESSSSVPPLQPPPPPAFSRVYEDEDFDLYADIEPPRLAPPPEPPALLLALEGDEGTSSPEDPGLVIDDRQTYDPELPTSPPPSPPPDEPANDKKVDIDQAAIDLSTIRLPSPEPDIDDCPNRVFYSETSISIAKDNEESDGEIDLSGPVPLMCSRSSEHRPEVDKKGLVVNSTNVTSNEKPNIDGKCSSDELVQVKTDYDKTDSNVVGRSEQYDPELSDDEVDLHIKGVDSDQIKDTAKVKNEEDEKKGGFEKTDKGIESGNDDNVKKEDFNKENVKKEDIKTEDTIKDCKEIVNSEIQEDGNGDKIKKENINNGISKGNYESIVKYDEASKSEDEMNPVKNELPIMGEKEGELKESEEGEINEDKGEGSKEMYDKDDLELDLQKEFELVKDNRCNDNKSCSGLSPSTQEDTFNSSADNDGKLKDVDSSPGSTPRKPNKEKDGADQEGDDVLELGCGDEKDGLVDITDEEISTYEKSWELEDNQAPNGKSAGIEGLETEAISEGEDNMAEEGQIRSTSQNGPKEEGEIISEEKRAPVAWKKVTKAKERSYRDKDNSKEKSKKKEKKPKEKRKELERYDVRKIISDKPKKRRVDEFGRDISSSRSRSLLDSKSKSRSRSIGGRSIRSRRSRSRSISKGKRRRSRERRSRSRGRSRVRSRDRSRGRSRGKSRERVKSGERSKRRPRTKTRSRSASRRRKSRSPRKKERRSRGKSREKKRRQRESSLSCSSCSCSSCERERRGSKNLTVIVPNEPATRKEKKKSKYKERSEKRRRVDSPVPSKEVFTSGDNILVSVNFKASKSGDTGRKESSKKKKDDESKKKKDKNSKENQPLRSIVSKSNQSQKKNRLNARNLKPVAIIDLAQSPFREQTLSPKEVIVLTDSDSDEKRKPNETSLPPCQVTGPKTPPEPHIKFNIVNSKPQVLRTLANPLLDSMDPLDGDGEEEEDERVEIPHKGPNTPPEPPVPYDPFEPTKSRSPTPTQDIEETRKPPTPPGDKPLPPEPATRPVSPPKPPIEPPKTPSPLHSPPPKPAEDNPPDKAHISPPNNHDDDSMDIGGGDSPYSPGSSDGEDLFEPPALQITAQVTSSKVKSRPGAKLLPKLTPSPLKRKPGSNKTTTPLKSNKGSKKESIGMNEDQLKILDDLPNSAVEMQVKDKFLKKLHRQERVVEEVKMVLKPHYAKKHITKEEYKEILRKSVPKICHSRSGEINPIKIQRLIDAYVKKYRHLRKKRKIPPSNSFSAPESLLKPKPKPTMWC